MANLNKVFLIGQPDARPGTALHPARHGGGASSAWPSIASGKAPNGEKKEEVCFVDCQAWARGAETHQRVLQERLAALRRGAAEAG